MIQESTKRLMASMGSLLFIALSLYVYSSFISPQIASIQELRGQRQAKLTMVADYEKAIQDKNKIIARYQGIKELQNVFNEVVPSSQNIPSLLNQLYGLAQLNNVLVDSIEFQEMPLQTTTAESLVKPHGTIQATIRCASNYENLKAYLAAIETNIRLMSIRQVVITEGFQNNPTLSYIVTVEAYYLAP